METINNRFLYYKKYNNFIQDYDQGKIKDDSIVFIEDTNSIWTHKHEYTCNCSDTPQEQIDLSEYLKKSEVQDYIPEQDLSQYVKQESLTQYVKTNDLFQYAKTDSLSRVSISGSYNDLNDIPFITITTEQYQRLVDTNQVKNNVYYFTYEGEPETEGWHFGDGFPITFSGDTWGFGDGFPITLTDEGTSDSIGTFPINLE